MLPINGMPVIEIISRQLYYYGFNKVAVSLGHLSDIVKLFLESKSQSSGMPEFEYFTEFKSLGTSGPIKAISPQDENFLVINGDILTSINLLDFMEKHSQSGAILSLSARKANYELPFGSLTIDSENFITNFEEKPKFELLDNIGIYIYSKRVLDYIHKDEHIDVNQLVERLLERKQKIFAYINKGPYYWVDIGTHADYDKVNNDFDKIKDQFPFLNNKREEAH